MRLLFFWLVYCLATAYSFLFSIDGNFLLNDGTFFETMDIPLESFQHNFPELCPKLRQALPYVYELTINRMTESYSAAYYF